MDGSSRTREDDLDLQRLLPSSSSSSLNNLNTRNNRVRRGSGTWASLRRYRCLMLALISLIIFLGMAAMYNCPETYCFSRQPRYTIHPPPAPLQIDVNFIDYNTIQHENFEFNLNGSDVMVYLHIQKTGGTTFGKHLVQDIDLEKPCLCRRRPKKHKKQHHNNNYRHKRMAVTSEHVDFYEDELPREKRKLKCDCFRPDKDGKVSNWLFSRYTTGWRCGLHPDWTELTECVDIYFNRLEGLNTRRYFYITFLRDPVRRYLSEFKHVQRGATWKAAVHMCNGVPATRAELPPCYDDANVDDWSGVSLDQFMACPSNLATNRQTRMLADLRQVNCYNTSLMSTKARDMIMLNSAKQNLEKMAFYGLTEKQIESQFLFQHTFDMNFLTPFVQYEETHSAISSLDLDQDAIDQITELNHLDVELYDFAKTIMEQRYNEAKLLSSTTNPSNN